MDFLSIYIPNYSIERNSLVRKNLVLNNRLKYNYSLAFFKFDFVLDN